MEIQHNGYTVRRLSSAYLQVQGKNAKAHLLMATVGDKTTPSCPCHKPGACQHQEAAKAFLAIERQPQAQSVVSMEDRLTWA
jgi:hypothetical protein